MFLPGPPEGLGPGLYFCTILCSVCRALPSTAPALDEVPPGDAAAGGGQEVVVEGDGEGRPAAVLAHVGAAVHLRCGGQSVQCIEVQVQVQVLDVR